MQEATGQQWPGEPATARTPVAEGPAAVRTLAGAAADVAEVDAGVSVCRACPRLVDWREQVARERRKAFAEQVYWGRPVPGFGVADPALLVVGLAPAAHGANRTGRMFTGDRSGDWLYRAMYRAGFANQPECRDPSDGLRLLGARVTAAVRCAPPANKPTPAERDACEPWLLRELELAAPTVRVVVALGAFAWQAAWHAMRLAEYVLPTRRPAFGHGVEVPAGRRLLLGSFHPSQQNTFTGKLTQPMFDAVFTRAAEFIQDR
ncbi:MAG: uracil-DNA glycosylase [Streptosporangiales bacterium]|nr:uracil-DNA glycosylase [Streptosporangiales bacterium]